MAIVDAHYRFIYVDVGVNGRIGDACLWMNSSLKDDIESNELPLPEPRPLPMTKTISPYTFISDDAFPLKSYMMKPYSKTHLTEDEIRFNYMLSRNRRVVENAFGQLANRFQFLFTPIFREPTEAIKIVLAAVCLHNFLSNCNMINRRNMEQMSDEEVQHIVSQNYVDYSINRSVSAGRPSKVPNKIRQNLTTFFKVFRSRFDIP